MFPRAVCAITPRMSAQALKPATQADTAAVVEKALAGAIPGVSPGGLLEAMEDPTVIERQSRALAYVQIATISKMSSSPAFTMANRLKFLELLAKLGKLIGADVQVNMADKAPAVNIVFEGGADQRPVKRPALKLVQDDADPVQIEEIDFSELATLALDAE